MNTKTITKNNIIIYEGKDGNIELRADVEKDTIWATQGQIAELFDVNSQAITKHLQNIYGEGELIKNSTCSILEQVQKEGGRTVKRQIECYNLDAIIAVGYRVNSKKATQFRIWATGVLREYLKNGYTLNRYKLDKSPEALLDLYAAMSSIESKGLGGKLRGKVTFKMTQDFESGGK
jgi:hypothetical protein